MAARRSRVEPAHDFPEAALDRDTTLGLFAIAAAFALLSRWGDARRRRDPHGALALLPWHALMFVALVGMLFMGVHLLALLGARN